VRKKVRAGHMCGTDQFVHVARVIVIQDKRTVTHLMVSADRMCDFLGRYSRSHKLMSAGRTVVAVEHICRKMFLGILLSLSLLKFMLGTTRLSSEFFGIFWWTRLSQFWSKCVD
jgi:hypothetical protein